MDAYLRPQVSFRFITTIIRQRKKDIGEIEKIEKYIFSVNTNFFQKYFLYIY